MKQDIRYAATALMLAICACVPLTAQEPSPQKSDLIDPDAMEALNRMGT